MSRIEEALGTPPPPDDNFVAQVAATVAHAQKKPKARGAWFVFVFAAVVVAVGLKYVPHPPRLLLWSVGDGHSALELMLDGAVLPAGDGLTPQILLERPSGHGLVVVAKKPDGSVRWLYPRSGCPLTGLSPGVHGDGWAAVPTAPEPLQIALLEVSDLEPCPPVDTWPEGAEVKDARLIIVAAGAQ